jgi:[methyl-Co(III) methanol-specific corrinoid protein]:coenzyme M methyltransferase
LPIRTVLDSLGTLKRRLGDSAVITGKAMGPWTLAIRLFGLEELLIGTLDDPPMIEALMETLAQVTARFIDAQLESGADVVTVADHITSNLVSPGTYIAFVQPQHRELNARFPGKLILHCCGNTMDRIAHFRDGGFPWFHFESGNPVGEALKLAGTMRLIGNVNIPDVLLGGTEEAIAAAVRGCLAGGLSMVSPECAIPLETPDRNLVRLVKTVQEGRLATP